MKKIICIGECALNIVLGADGSPMGSLPGGRIVNAAAIMAKAKNNVIMAAEASADPVGDIVANYLKDSGVDISSLDRFTEGRTPVNIFTCNDGIPMPSSMTRYEEYPENCFDIIWPRVEEGDIVLFGGHYSIDSRMRPRLQRFLNNCIEHKALLIYLPGFMPQQEPRITRVMPAILENLEIANVVVARNNDLRLIFGIEDSADAYHNHINFYCRSLISVDAQNERISYYSGKEMSSVNIPSSTCKTLLWNSGAVAGLTSKILELGLSAEQLEAPDATTREEILGAAALSANQTAQTLNEKQFLSF